MENNKREIKISVRNLVEFILRSGSIDSRFAGKSNAVEGTRIHKKVQKAAGPEYATEVFLKHTVEYDEFLLTVEGRADGIIKRGDMVAIDEIKSTTAPLDIIDENYNSLHWAQAKCYAYIYAFDEGINHINVQLTYYQIDTEQMKCIEKTYHFDELKDFFCQLVDSYLIWARFMYQWSIQRDQSIKNLAFPFENYRKGQRELAVAVYKTISGQKKLFVQAPTGVGKTISTLFPAVKAMGEGLTSRIFYLTAKTITRSVVEEAFAKMRAGGLKMKTVTLTAKAKICFKEKVICNPDECEYARGHYDRVNDAIKDILEHEDQLERTAIERYAEKHRVCPFEYSLDLTEWADTVICDYNYVFDPQVYLRRFFADNSGDYTFLIDEAHNLVDRAREMFSAELYKKTFLSLKKVTGKKSPSLSKILGRLNKCMLDLKKQCGESDFLIQSSIPREISIWINHFVTECEEYLITQQGSEGYEDLLQLYFDALAFIRISELFDERYVAYTEKTNDDVKFKLFCVDPSHLLGEALKRGKASVLFSATLLPLDYYRSILGGDSEDYKMYLRSSFESRNRCLLIADRVSTKFRNREKSYSEIVKYIKAVVNKKQGNYMIFFPSYAYMNAVYNELMQDCPEMDVYIQTPDMAEEDREDFLGIFKENPKKSTLGFCVLGGIFSEGIDLKNDRLIGAIIIGVGLPQICLERDIIKDYFSKKNNMGYEYAYMYPGMNKVLQAAGRVIRSETDRGIILLVDERFSERGYQELFPKEWADYKRTHINLIEKQIERFWTDYK